MRAEEMDRILDEALEDHRLSRQELRTLKAFVQAEATNDHLRAELRARSFERARSTMADLGADATLAWLERVVRVLSPVEQIKSETSVHFSPGDDCLNAIRSALRDAKKAVDICVFTITDDRISQGIADAHKRGVRVRVISDDDKAHDRGSDVDRLAFAGVATRFDRTEAHMHHKYAIFDDRRVLTGSYNWTRSAAFANQENIIFTNEPKAVRRFREHFVRLWDHLGS